MGCCASEKSSEEEEIIIYFNKILKENDFNFTIKNYNENYNKIQKLSGNNFKKLSKKQNVRNNFIKIVKRDGKIINYYTNKKEDTEKILYYIIILTLLLENKMKEEISIDDNYNEINKINLISLKTELLLYGYYLFNNMSTEKNINKNIIYHLAKMFHLCFKDCDNLNNYICVKTYINIIKNTIDNQSFEDEEESYIFIRDNLLALGVFFQTNNNYILSEEELIIILTEFYSIILFHHFDYLINNYSLIKENINKNIRNTTSKLMNFNQIANNKDNIIPNITQAFDIVNSANININIKNDYKDINLIIESFYYCLKVSLQDIYSGKNLLNLFGKKIVEKNIDNRFIDSLLLLIFYECCIKEDEKLTFCLLEHITDLILKDLSNIELKENNIYYDILLDSYYLLYKNDTLAKQYTSLISQIFIKENENDCKNPLFLTQLIQIYYKKEKMVNKLIKLFFSLLLNIGHYYKEKINSMNNNDRNIISNECESSTVINNILINLNSLIKIYFINYNEFTHLNKDKNTLISSSNNMAFNINNNINLMKIEINDYNLLIKHFFNFYNLKQEYNINNIEFYLYFHLFIINNTDIIEIINDYPKKAKIYHDIFKIITILEIMLIQNSDQEINNKEEKEEDNNNNIYINDIIITIQIILKLIEKIDTKYYIQDCYILYNSLEKNLQNLLELQKLNENGNNEIDFFNIKIIYSIIFFILTQFIRLIHIPNSMNKNHHEILDCITKTNEQCGKYLSSIDISNFISYNNSFIVPNLQYLKELLLSKNDKNKFFFNYNNLKQILDIIYSKLFGKDTSLHIFFDNQITNSKYFYNLETNSYNKSISKGSDNITEVQDNSMLNGYNNDLNENYIDDISIQIVEQKNKIKNNDNISENIFMNNNSKINIPTDNENLPTDERMLTNSITNEENLFQNIKI